MRFIILFLAVLLISSCIKKDENNSQINIENENIDFIGFYIFNDLNIEWIYGSLEEYLIALNITENYTISESIIENTIQTATGYFFLFDIESTQYKFRIYAFSNNNTYIEEPKMFRLGYIEVEINDNYINLFPYNNIKGYLNNVYFGRIDETNSGENNISYYFTSRIRDYGGDDQFGYCDLIFDNGILKSIKIMAFIP